MPKRVELAVGAVSAPRILHHYDVAVCSESARLARSAAAIVRCSREQHRKRIPGIGSVHIGCELDAIAHLSLYVALHRDIEESVLRIGLAAGKCGKEENREGSDRHCSGI